MAAHGPSSRSMSWTARMAARLAVPVACFVALQTAFLPPAQAHRPDPAPADAVLSWNSYAVSLVVGVEKRQQPESFVYLAYTQAAVYDAVVAVRGGLAAYLPGSPHRPHASVDAAVAAAAYGVLVHYFPDQQSALQGQYAASLAGVPDDDAKDDGVEVGGRAAAAVLAARADDGFTRTVTYAPAPGPGVWQPTPPGLLPAQTPQLGTMRPFLLDSADQLRPAPPPALDSDRWAQDYHEVADLGSLQSTTRTADQTATAQYWVGNVVVMYNRLYRELAVSHHLDARSAARLLLAGDMVGADALIACMEAKYHYGLWRPVTAIRAGDTDGRGDTAADATWTPLLTTPNHPEYPSNHGCISAATAAVTASFLRTSEVSVDLFSTASATSRHFATVSDWLASVGDGRVWGGIHYRFSTDTGVALGAAVAQVDLMRLPEGGHDQGSPRS